MKAALSTCKDDIFPPRPANTGGSQRTACSPECSPSCPNLNLGASRTPCDHVTLFGWAECSSLYRPLDTFNRNALLTSILNQMNPIHTLTPKLPYAEVLKTISSLQVFHIKLHRNSGMARGGVSGATALGNGVHRVAK
jgi:hypothetical protein